jgi:dienelactone hydrolase
MVRNSLFVVCCAWAVAGFAQAPNPLPGTASLDWPEEDLSTRMMDGAHQFVERKIAEAASARKDFWTVNAASNSFRENREHLRTILGAVNPRVGWRMERFGDDANPALVAETPLYRVYQVRWGVLDGVDGEGLLVEPKQGASARVVAIPDADQTPEQIMGLAPGVPAEQQFARRLAESGCQLIVPVLVDRHPLATNDEQIKRSQQSNREWLYRQAFHMGRHIIGYEVQKVEAAADWLSSQNEAIKTTKQVPPIGIAGYAEGGQIALYAAALRSGVRATLVSGYFDSRDRVWSEPIYRNVWGFTKRFSDADLARLIWPHHLVIEHSSSPTIEGHKGNWQTPSDQNVAAEFARIQPPATSDEPILIRGEAGEPVGPMSEQALTKFVQPLFINTLGPAQPPGQDLRKNFDPSARQQRTVKQIEQHVQNLIRASDQVRDKSFLLKVMPELGEAKWNTDKSLPTKSAERFVEGAKAFREKFATEAMGRFDEPLLPENPRTRKIIENDKWTAYDVVLDVFPELFAWGVLVVPKDIKPGERRPVVVCQHGRNGLPRMLIDGKESAYNQFAARLAERGFVTFAPHNLYRGEDRYRWLSRKANTIEATLFSFIIPQHDQILRWLEQQPFVDGKRMAFYGLSYGGETAVRVPPILEKYCLSICSGDFNQWTTKVASTDQPFSFMRTIEWEMPYWNLGQTFDYAEMSYLMLPRPFMVERGHLDMVGRDAWVAHEYAKVRWLYAQLGLADRTEIEFFQGGHSIHGEGTFAFLHKHLDWPPPTTRDRSASEGSQR